MSEAATTADDGARPAAGWALPLALIAGITLWRLGLAALVPVTKDETYYVDWARHLAWGYFDHPPGVALLGLGTWLAPGSALAARLGAVLAGALTLLLLWAFYRRCGLRRRGDLLLALVLASTTIAGLIAGIITTPDTALALCWALALHEGAAALESDRRRWLTTGIATGLGLLGKYTMAVIGPVFLWALLRADPKALRSPWPYLGGLLALLVFLPNILWNAHHDWLTLRFQFGHGFATETGAGAVPMAADALPAALPLAGSAEADPLVPRPPPGLAGRLVSVATYVGTQLAFWGLLLVPMTIALLRRGGLRRARRELAATLTPAGRTLLTAGTVVPLVVFAAVAWISDVEANWSGMYLATAAGLAAVLLRPWPRRVLLAAALNLLLIGVYALHAATGVLPLPDAAERILRETRGYEALAAHAAELPRPVFTDRYQTTALLNFYDPGLGVGQWPGITRPSEYLGGRITAIPSLNALRHSGFSLITRRYRPAPIPGFEVARMQTLFDCGGSQIVVLDGDYGSDDAPCARPAHHWDVYVYRATTDTAEPDGSAGAAPGTEPIMSRRRPRESSL